jgi:hypothetical protein
VWVRAPPPAAMLLPMRKAHFSNPAEKIYDGFRTERRSPSSMQPRLRGELCPEIFGKK